MAIRIGSSAAASQQVVAWQRWAKTGRDWALKTIGGILVGLITAIWTPVGDAAVEWVHPTEAHVEGTVVQNGNPARGLIRLDGKHVDESNSLGVYVFDDVPKGSHDLLISQDGELVYDLDIHVAAKQETLTVPTIDLAAAVPIPKGGGSTGEANPHYVPAATATPEAEATATATTAGPVPAPTADSSGEDDEADSLDIEATYETDPKPAASPEASWEWDDTGAGGSSTTADRDEIALVVDSVSNSEDQTVTVRVEAGYDVLSKINRVTYYLDPSFDPSVVTRYDPWDDFTLTFPVPSAFDLIARIYFADGTSADLTAAIGR